MENIQEVHERIYAHLIEKHKQDPNFRFTTRITNRFKRLEQGYWFHGNEHYLVVSFWSGTDWMNKTPNIMFVYTPDECSLEISVWDSATKREFVDDYLVQNIEDLVPGGKYKKHLGYPENEDYISLLDKFLNTDKIIIDEQIQENGEYLDDDDNALGFITPIVFDKWVSKVESYRKSFYKNEYTETINPTYLYDLSDSFIINRVHIKKFPGLGDCLIDNIPDNNRCVFLTGENGTGKSLIMKAIGAAIMDDHDHEILKNNKYEVEMNILRSGNSIRRFFSYLIPPVEKRSSLINGYAAYGPSRLTTNRPSDGRQRIPRRSFINKPNANLFSTDAKLYDIEQGLLGMRTSKELMDERKRIIATAIRDIIPGFKDISWGKKNESNEWEHTKYDLLYDAVKLEDDSETKFDETSITIEEGNKSNYVTFDQLATGAKSILAMIGDMIIRLFEQQRTVDDIANLKGVVLIDEIDIHLHPTFQRLIVKRLTDNFPNIQFFISTHSPIPLLGAPPDSIFYVVKRNGQRGTYIEKIDGIHIENLTPNNILTSPIFGMRDITSVNHEKGKVKLITNDNYSDYLKSEETRQRLKEIANELKKRFGNDL
ncbi:hypothetical protein CAP35_12560 [Chitinophagaceae bacterium IBVUCB1]|nr:hypothetical protein CAP35_12560 [Chitinophagaceae bacterium IBVUCB1]